MQTLRQHLKYKKLNPNGTSEELRRFASILYCLAEERKIQCPYCDALNDTQCRTLLVKHYLRSHINERDEKNAAFAVLNIKPCPTYDIAWELGRKKIDSAKCKKELDKVKLKIFNPAIMPLLPVGENPFWPQDVPRPNRS